MTEKDIASKKFIEELRVEGAVTAKEMVDELGISKATANRYFEKISKLYPGSVAKVKDLNIKGTTYGTGKPVRVISGKVYTDWLEHYYYKSAYNDLYGLDDGSIFRNKLESKSKDELIDEIISLKADLEGLRDSIFNKIDKEIKKL